MKRDFLDLGTFARRLRRGGLPAANPMGFFLLATLVLVGWLGYQALDAAASQRRTAESVLHDYAEIAAAEMAGEVQDELDDVLDDVFDPLDDMLDERGSGGSSARGSDLPSPRVLGWDLDDAMRHQGCRCRAFQSPLALFRLDPATGTLDAVPDTLSAESRRLLVERVTHVGLPRSGQGVGASAGAGMTGAHGVGGDAGAIGYFRVDGPDGPDAAAEAIFGFVASAAAIQELFRHWYDEEPLLPSAIAEDLPNDSLLHVTVRDSEGWIPFTSPLAHAATSTAVAPVAGEFGDLSVHVAVRPEAAGQLVIGGLPGSRLPFLALLLLLTLGVGVAAVVQHRREQVFQALRDDFISGVSHELRTPLAQIRMFSELQESGKLASQEDHQRATAAIHRESRRLSHLVENILQFSRLRRHPEQGIPREPLHLRGALEEGLDAVIPLIEDRDMKLTFEGGSDAVILANRDALTRIVVNLIDNAAKYGPRGQTVRVGVEQADGAVRLTVEDQGPGVPTSERDRIWRPYCRLERDVRAQLPGTGIGLSVVWQLSAWHGGQAWVEDGPGGGARFVVEFPLVSRTAEPSRVTAAAVGVG